MEFATQIRQRLADVGISPITCALSHGLPRDAIRSVLRGHPPSIDRAQEICRALGLEFYIGPSRPSSDAENLYSGVRDTDSAPPYSTERGLAPAHLRTLEASAQGLVRVVSEAGGDPIPDDLRAALLGLDEAAQRRSAPQADAPPSDSHINVYPLAWDVRAAAGAGALVFEEVAEYRIAIPRAAVPSWVRHDKVLCIRATGDSMTPTLPVDSVIALDSSSIEPLDGEIFVIAADEGLVVKRLREDDDGWSLVSDNPAYPPRRIREPDRVVGRVAWFGTLREGA